MSFLSQYRRHHIMSPAAQDVASKALAQLADAQTAAGLSATASQVPSTVNDLRAGRVALASATVLGFRSVGFDLYTLSTEDPLLPTVWKKDTVIDPVTGKRTEWLVAYTTDDDDIARSTIAMQKTADATQPVPVPATEQVQVTNQFRQNMNNNGTVWRQKIDANTNSEVNLQTRMITIVSRDYTERIAPRIPAIVRQLMQTFNEGSGVYIIPDPQGLSPYKNADGSTTFRYQLHVMQKQQAPAQPQQAAAAPVTGAMKLHAVAADAPKKNTAPIAPGILTKNLTLDQSGQGGSAKVTVDFNDPQKGEEFFKQVEELAGGVGGGEVAPAEKPPAAEEEQGPPVETPPEEGAGQGGPAGGTAVVRPPQSQQIPKPVPAGAPMASTIKNLTHFGSKIVYLTMEKYATFAPVYFFVNEDGQRVDVALPARPKVGATMRRPDTGENIRIGGLTVVESAADDDAILSHLLATAVDISDQIPPMGWTNKESQNEEGEGGAKPLPPNPALQQGAGPTADTATPPLYDSQTAPEQGQKNKFQMSVDPNTNAVTVKFSPPPALDAIDQAVQGQQPPMGGQPVPPPAPGGPAAQPPPMNGQPKDEFSQSESPTQF